MKHNQGHPIPILIIKIPLPSVVATGTSHFAKVSLHSCSHTDLISKSRFILYFVDRASWYDPCK